MTGTKHVESTVRDAAAEMGVSAKAGPFGLALLGAAARRSDLVATSADLKKYTDLTAFAKQYPDRYVDVGMAEQNLVCVAAGLARAGYGVVATSFAAFLTRRALDFIVMQIALPKLPVVLVGATPGVSATFGPSHTGVEDLAIMRAVPHMTVLDPADPAEAAEALTWALDAGGPVYLRQPFNRADTARTDDTIPPFVVGEAAVLRTGDDLTLVSSGDRLRCALAVADRLMVEGYDVSVVRAGSVKPFDAETVAECARRTRRVVTLENHSLRGGLFSTVCEVVASRSIPAIVAGNGVDDTFAPFGSPPHVLSSLSMAEDDVTQLALELLTLPLD